MVETFQKSPNVDKINKTLTKAKLGAWRSAQPKNYNLPVWSIKPVFHHEKGKNSITL